MSAAIAAAGIGAATSIGLGVAASQSGKKAAGKSAKASQDQNVLNMNMLLSGKDSSNALLDPYTSVGEKASNQLAFELGLGGPGKTAGILNKPYGMAQYKNDPGYTPMVNSLEELQNTPGYKFQLEQGLQGVNNSASAKGSLLSGKQLKGIDRYSQGVASQGYQSAWDRAQQAYQAAFSRNQSQNQQRFSQLYHPSSLGFNSANQQGNNITDTYTAIANGNNGQQANNTANTMYQADQTQNAMSNTNQALQKILADSSLRNTIKGTQAQPYDNISSSVSNATKNWGSW